MKAFAKKRELLKGVRHHQKNSQSEQPYQNGGCQRRRCQEDGIYLRGKEDLER